MIRFDGRVRTCLPLLLMAAIGSSWGAQRGTPAEIQPPNNEAIAAVEAGKVDTAHASWWGFDPADATHALQAAFNCRAQRVLVERMPSPWIVTTVQLPSDKEIIFQRGVVVEAKRGEFRGKSDCLFVARGCKRLRLLGAGATLRMHKSDYHKPPYALAEWRHALSLRGCEDVTIQGLTFAESGGDGIYLGVGAERATNRNITIRNVVCDANNRQGISVITAENLLIEDSVFCNTRGTAPEAGIDFEPNHPQERLVNCTLRNCRSHNNAGQAYHLYLGQMHQESPPVSIRFENCSSLDCQGYSAYVGMANRDGKRTVKGSIEYVDCQFEGDQRGGVYIRGNEADGSQVSLTRCEIIRQDEPPSKAAPITIVAPQQLNLDAGNIHLVDCVIRDATARKPITLSASAMTRLRNITGSLTVVSSDQKTTYTLDAEQPAEWFPTQGLVERIPRRPFDWRTLTAVTTQAMDGKRHASFRLRRKATLLVWCREGVAVELTAILEAVGRHDPVASAITMVAADGQSHRIKPQVMNNQVRYSFTPQVNGPHRLEWQGHNNETFRPVRCTQPLAILGTLQGISLVRPQGSLGVTVPRDVERFAIVVTGAGTAETVKATIRNASGQVVDQQDNVAASHVFVLERDRSQTHRETWSITFEKASEGVLEDVTLHAVGIPPLFAAIP